MKCPVCGFLDDKVIDSRSVKEGAGVRRRRVCLKCSARFSTYEGIIQDGLKVIKRNGVIEDYDKEKLYKGIANACYKRSISSETMEQLVEEINLKIQTDYDKEIASSKIGEYVMNALKELDQVAYVRFASIYRKFKDVEEFIMEIRALS